MAELAATQLAPATAALDMWITNPDGCDYRAPWVPQWSQSELEEMHKGPGTTRAPHLLRTVGAY